MHILLYRNLGEMVVKTLNNLKLGESLKLKSQCLENIVKNRKFFCSIALWSRNKNPMKILRKFYLQFKSIQPRYLKKLKQLRR